MILLLLLFLRVLKFVFLISEGIGIFFAREVRFKIAMICFLLFCFLKVTGSGRLKIGFCEVKKFRDIMEVEFFCFIF